MLHPGVVWKELNRLRRESQAKAAPKLAKGLGQEIPDDFDPEQERRRLKAGGCCGKPAQPSHEAEHP